MATTTMILMMSDSPDSPDSSDEEMGRTALSRQLLIAAEKNDLLAVKDLLAAGASDIFCSRRNHYYGLHWAAHHNNVAMASLFIKHGADALDKRSRTTPLEVAAKKGLRETLLLCMNAAYSQHVNKKKKSHLNLVKKAIALGEDVTLALAHYLFRRYEQSGGLEVDTEDMFLLIEKIRPFIIEANGPHQVLACQIGLFLLKLRQIEHYPLALTWFALAGDAVANRYDNVSARMYKAICYNEIVGEKNWDVVSGVPSSLKDVLQKDELEKVILDTPLLSLLEAYAKKNAAFCNELAEIYEVLERDKECIDYSLLAARLGSRESIFRLAESEPFCPILAKYKFICCLLDWKNHDQGQITEWLEVAKKYSKEDLRDYLYSAPSVSSDFLRTPQLLSIDPDLAILLFKNHHVRRYLSENEKQAFLIQCAYHCPQHKWVSDVDRLTTLVNYFQASVLPAKVRTTYFVLALLNDTGISNDMAKVAEDVLDWSDNEIDERLSSFAGNYDEKKLERVKHIIRLYQYLVNLTHPTVDAWPLPLDKQGLHQLFDLIHKNQFISNKHSVESIIQKVAIVELSKSVKACKTQEEREALLKEAKASPLYTTRNTFCGNPLRLFPQSVKRQVVKHTKEEEKQQRRAMRKGRVKED